MGRHTHRSTVRLRLEALDAREMPSANALDLTARGSSGEINGATFRQDDTRPTGSGVIHSFLRVQGAAAHGVTQQGYNTDARPLQFDENKSPTFTHSLRLSDLPRVFTNGAFYRVLLLDINQKSSQPFLSLDQLRVFVADAPNLTGYDAATGTLAGHAAGYDLDADGDSWVKLDYRLNSGSGSGDMLAFIPEAAFAGAGDNPFVYVYSQFGEHFAGNAGFQEWAPGHGTGVDNPTSSIRGTVTDVNTGAGLSNQIIFIDLNNNGVLDADEPYTITDAGGHYAFTDLPPSGDGSSLYYVRQITQDGFTQVTGNPDGIVLGPGVDLTGIDFGDSGNIRPT